MPLGLLPGSRGRIPFRDVYKRQVQKREYDPVGRMVHVLDFDGNDIRLSYDGIDNLSLIHI